MVKKKLGRGGGIRTRDLPVSVGAPAVVGRLPQEEPRLQPGALTITELRPVYSSYIGVFLFSRVGFAPLVLIL